MTANALRITFACLIINLTCNAQLQVAALVKHTAAQSRNAKGAITLTVSGGTEPYSYMWSNGIYPDAKDRNNVARGAYTLHLKDANNNSADYSYNLGYKPIWQVTEGLVSRNDSLLFDNGSGYGEASSLNTLSAEADGWTEYIVKKQESILALGYSDNSNSWRRFNDILFGFYIENNLLYVIYEGYFQYIGWVNPGDIIRISKIKGVFSLGFNEDLVFKSESSKQLDLTLKTIIWQSSILMDAGISFPDITSSLPLHVSGLTDHIDMDGIDQTGGIQLNVSGGSSPYIYEWDQYQDSTDILSNVPKGDYVVTVADHFKKESFKFVGHIGYKVNWEKISGPLIYRNDSLFHDPDAQESENGTAVTENTLKQGVDGWTELIVASAAQNKYAIGFVPPSENYKEDWNDITFGVAFFSDQKELYLFYQGCYSYLDHFQEGDVIRIGRKQSLYYVEINGKTYQEEELGSFEEMKVKAFLSDATIAHLGCSFSKPLVVDYTKGNVKSADEPNTGYISLIPKYGVPPYSFEWSDGNNERIRGDLAPGDYFVTVRDANLDEVNLAISIGEELKWVNANNMSLNHEGIYTLTDMNKPGALSVNRYANLNEPGFFDFKINRVNNNFNFVLNPYSVDKGYFQQPAVVIKRSVVKMSKKDLPDKNSAAFNDIEFFGANNSGDSLQVVKKELVSDTCRSCEHLRLSGVVCYYGTLYSIENGQTIKKGEPLADGDRVRLAWNNGSMDILKNETGIATIGYPLANPFIIITGNFETPFGPKGPLGGLYGPGWSSVDAEGGGGTNLPKDGCGGVCTNDVNMNWTQITVFDEAGNIVGDQRSYSDYRGMNKQSQVKNLSEGKVIVSQPLYDAYGRAVGQSLPAPVAQQCFCYKPDFILKDGAGTAYSFNEFDKPNYSSNSSALSSGERDKPQPVKASTPFNLGWYYSNYNSWEKYVPVASTPYSRIVYSKADPSSVLKSARPGDQLNCGSGHEVYSFKMATAGELNNVFGFGAGWRIDEITNFNDNTCGDVIRPVPLLNTAPLSLKTISLDENGIESVAFNDLSGNLIATCLSGKLNGNNVKTQSVESFLSFYTGLEEQAYVDVHLPNGCENSLIISAPLPSSSSATSPKYHILNLKTGELVKINGSVDLYPANNASALSPNLPPGYYRIMVVDCDPSYRQNASAGVKVNYNLNYYNFSLNYYDYANRLKASISPNGFDDSYELSYDQSFFNNPQSIAVISSGANQPQNFSEGKTWSFDPHSFSNSLSLNLGSAGANSNQNLHIGVSLSNRATPALGDLSGPGTCTVSKGFYTQLTSVRTMEDISIPKDDLIVKQTDVNFYVSLALLDADGQVIESTIKASSDLKCTVLRTQSGTEYHSWTPLEFNYDLAFTNTKESTITPTWQGIKLLDLHPVSPSLGEDPSVYEALAGEIVVTSNGARFGAGSHPLRRMPDMYRYDSWSQVLNTASHNEGVTDMVYTSDGKPAFIQNSKQDGSATNYYNRKYSFSVFDEVNRPVMSGEYDPTSTGGGFVYFESDAERLTNPVLSSNALSIFSLLGTSNYNPGAFAAGAGENIFMAYDSPDPNFLNETGGTFTALTATYTQRHVSGRLSYSYNDTKKTWYSYDEQGRTEWVVQKYYNVNPSPSADVVKSFRYSYDAAGHLAQTIYNEEDAGDRLYHTYDYDPDGRMRRAYTRRNAGDSPSLQASYSYYLHGPLKRTELGAGLQGQDYVYTINGWLKTMNSPEMDSDHDPGRDGYATSAITNKSFKDLFGFALDYYYDDYTRASTRVQSNADANYAPDQFNGIIKAQRWQTFTKGISSLAYANQHLIYRYKYDNKYQLSEASFGQVTANSTQNTPSPVSLGYQQTALTNDYKVYNLAYDYNGNLMRLKRNAYGGTPLMDDLTYSYETCSNRLSGVTDAVTAQTYGLKEFKPGQSSGGGNYSYNSLGELSSEINDDKKYEYNSQGNITAIRKYVTNNLVAEYKYDEAGMRTLKTDYINNKTTLYVRDAGGQIIATFDKTGTGNTNTYTSPSQWDIYAAGRVGVLDNSGSSPAYIYELADHLGNVRATFKKDLQTTISTNFDSNNNTDWFTNNGTLVNTFGNAISPTNTNWFTRTQYPGAQMGAGSKLIQVNYGDYITISYKAYWQSTSGAPLAGVIIDLVDAAGNVLPSTVGAIGIINLINTGAANIWNSKQLSFTISDNYQAMYIRFTPVNADVNEVFFDDLALTFNNGSGVYQPQLLSMADYYPHGSVMPGLNYTSSYNYRYGYQGQFAEMDKESNENFFELRNYDPLLGRFKTTDPYGQYWSPYLAMGNSHPNGVDPDGGFNAEGAIVGAAIGAGVGIVGAIVTEAAGNHELSTQFVNATPYLMAAGALGGGFGAEIAEFALSPLGQGIFAGASMAAHQIGMSYGDDPPVKMKPASAYDYSKGTIPGKLSDDWNYVWKGADGNVFSRAWNLFKRDWGQASLSQKADLILAAGGPLIRIGKVAVPKELFHRVIKGTILKAARKIGNYEKLVGKNPDIGIENGKITLNGVGKFKGKKFETGLNADDFFH